MSKFTGKINIPILKDSNFLDVMVFDGVRLIKKEHLKSLFEVLGISDYKNTIELFRYSKDWVQHEAMINIILKEYLKFNNGMATIIFKGMTTVGLLSLIDEATGYNKVTMSDSYYQDIFNKNLIGG